MSSELVALLAVVVAFVGLLFENQQFNRSELRTELAELRREVGDLRERTARLESLPEGLRETAAGRLLTGGIED